MDDRVYLVVYEHFRHEFAIADVTVNESISLITCDRLEARLVAGVSQRIQNDDAVVRIIRRPILDKVRADEAGAAGHEQASHRLRRPATEGPNYPCQKVWVFLRPAMASRCRCQDRPIKASVHALARRNR